MQVLQETQELKDQQGLKGLVVSEHLKGHKEIRVLGDQQVLKEHKVQFKVLKELKVKLVHKEVQVLKVLYKEHKENKGLKEQQDQQEPKVLYKEHKVLLVTQVLKVQLVLKEEYKVPKELKV